MDNRKNRDGKTRRAQFALPPLLAAMAAVALWLTPPAQAQEPTADCGDGNPLHGRTQKVVDAILAALSTDDCSAVTATQLAGITTLNLDNKELSSLVAPHLPDRRGDFDGLSKVETLHLNDNEMTELPAHAFNGLSRLQNLSLNDNGLTGTLERVFDGLFLLRTLNLSENELTALHEDVFADSGHLENLQLNNNDLAALPSDVFDGLSKLENLHLNNNGLTALPNDVFDGLSKLENLHLNENELTALHEDVFDGLSSLETLRLNNNDLTALPSGVFDGLSSLETLQLNNNDLTALPSGVFDGLSGLETLRLNNNDLTALPGSVFDSLSKLETLQLDNNDLTALPSDMFDDLSSLETLQLDNNDLTALPPDVFTDLSSLEDLQLNNNDLTALPPDVFTDLSSLEDLQLDGNSSLACIHAGQFNGLSKLRLLHLDDARLGNIDTTYFAGWDLDNLEELRLGASSPGQWYARYSAVLPALQQAETFVIDTNKPSHPICGSIAAREDAGGYHQAVQVNLAENSVRPNRVRVSGSSGDGVCGSDRSAYQHELWTWQLSDDGLTNWTDSPRQPPGYGDRAEGECSYIYTPQADDNGKHVRAYVPVTTAGVGDNNYYTTAFGPLNIQP